MDKLFSRFGQKKGEQPPAKRGETVSPTDPFTNLDPRIYEEARKQRNPSDKGRFFAELCNKILNELDPPTPFWEEETHQIFLEEEGIKRAYSQLFGTEMYEDLPELEEQFRFCKEANHGMITDIDLIKFTGLAAARLEIQTEQSNLSSENKSKTPPQVMPPRPRLRE